MFGELAWRGFGFAYGVVNLLALIGLAAFRDGALLRRTSKEEKASLDDAQNKYWNVALEPIPGFTHEFITLRNGLKIHYVVNSKYATASTKNVAIFIHGFPDSFLLWREILKAPNLIWNHTLIAVDLPGYGGSDGVQAYGPEEVLEAMTGFILGMREKYLKEDGKVVVASHDWGGIVSARLASEASALADRWIIASAVLPQLLRTNATTRYASAKQMLHTWLRSPYNIRLLKNAYSTLGPVLSQTGRSFYIFVLNLPWPIARFAATFGDYWLLRVMHSVAAGLMGKDRKLKRKLNVEERGDWMAMSSGPGIAQVDEAKGMYGESVRKRVKDAGMSEKIRVYREHLLLGSWEKSLEAVVALSEIPTPTARSNSNPGAGAGLFEDGPPGALKAPATIIYGKYDPAFERGLVLEGISDYLAKGSQVLLLEKSGHWLPHEELGKATLQDVVEWSLSHEDNKKLTEWYKGSKDIKFLVDM